MGAQEQAQGQCYPLSVLTRAVLSFISTNKGSVILYQY